MVRAFMLHSTDNVATLIDPATRGEIVSLLGQSSGQIATIGEIAFGHKLATRDIKRGDQIIKYGKVIGQATKDIAAGDHVHVHNVEALRARGDKKESQ